MMGSQLDIERQKYAEWKQQQKDAMRDHCERDCTEHNEKCPYFDENEEAWNYEQCFKDWEG